MRKLCLTAIIGNYDKLKEPRIITEGWDYICLTDQPLRSRVWKIEQCESDELSNVKLARYIKLKYFDIFKHSLCIWVDGTYQINCDLDKFVKSFHNGSLTVMTHPDRTWVSEEAAACIDLKKDKAGIILDQMRFYRNQKFPDLGGLAQTGLMIMTTSKVKKFNQFWFDQIVKWSHRDQLSFNYTLWKNPIKVTYFKREQINQIFIHSKHENKNNPSRL